MEEQELWKNVCVEESVKACEAYLAQFPNGNHADDVEKKKRLLEGCSRFSVAQLWHYVRDGIVSPSALKRAGLQAEKEVELRKKLDEEEKRHDPEWFEALQKNTADAYKEYSLNHPGQHEADIKLRIEQIEHQRQQEEMRRREAEERARQAESERQRKEEERCSENQRKAQEKQRLKESILDDIRKDLNYYSATELQDFIDMDSIDWTDLVNVFGSQQKADAIRDYRMPSTLPEGMAPTTLQDKTTEVYFWGMPASGKTCALGGIISSTARKGILEKLQCGGYDYMTRLGNIFNSRGFCTFPDSTAITTIQEMKMNLTDHDGHTHQLTLVDLAGELFRSVYARRHNLFLNAVNEATLETALSYLKDERNKKIHFFVVEYGAHEKEWDGLMMTDYLDDMVNYLKENKVFSKSTVGVYVLVTKCDKIACTRSERPREAYNYVRNQLPSFWGTLKRNCRDAGVADLKTVSYSVGDVFAQNLCRFDATDTEKVINRLLLKTPSIRGGFWGKLMESLRN